MTTEGTRHEFQAEVEQLLDLMVHSLYSNKEIFLRELISNASDALDRLRFEQLTREDLRTSDELAIRLEPDAEARTLTLHDNGIGMSRDEVVTNLGTIAKSGTKEFLKNLRGKGEAQVTPELIGQFGVGFYSSFMVAEEVTVVTRRAGESTATRWISTGRGYLLEDAERATPGTSITLKLKPVDEENGIRDFTSPRVLKEVVKRYSDFVAYPIQMTRWKEGEGGEGGAKILDTETLNSQKAIWARPKGEVTDEEYNQFYKHIAHDWTDPLERISVRIEGTFEAQALLFIPSRAPFDLFHPEMKRGIQLYVKRVFIMDECKELIPAYLRFVKGVVDAQDLSLNVSREILQQDRQIRAIKKQLTKKVLDTLDGMKKEKPEQYRELWAQFGAVLKEGLVNAEGQERDRLLELLLARSTAAEAEPVSLGAYVERMKEGQSEIYYLSGASLEAVQSSPHLEAFRAKGYEVLFFTDPIDEIWLDRAPTFQDKPLRSIGRGEVDLGTAEEKAEAEKQREEKERELKDVLSALRAHLQEDVKEVRLSSRLTTSAACLVNEAGDLTPQMEKIMRQLGQEVPRTKRILELNPGHELLAKLARVYEAEKTSPVVHDYAALLYGQALLAEGGQLPDPAAFSRLITDLMVRAI